MDNLEKEIIEYLDRQDKPISLQEICEDKTFDDIRHRVISKKLFELVLSKVIDRNIDKGIAYYFIKKMDRTNSIFSKSIKANNDKKIELDSELEQGNTQQENENEITEESDNYIRNERIEDIIQRTYNENQEDFEESDNELEDSEFEDEELEVEEQEDEELEDSEFENEKFKDEELEDENKIDQESIENEERKRIEEILNLSFEHNTKLLTFKEYKVNIPDKFIVENESRDYWYAWMPNPEYPEDIKKAIMIIYSSAENKDNLDVKIYNQQIWEIAQEFAFWYSKINKREEYENINYFPIIARYVSGGCTFSNEEQKYEYKLNLHINNIYIKFIININKGFKENEKQIEQMILNFANAIIPTSRVLPLEEIDSRYFIDEKLTTELLIEWKECFEIRLNENKTIMNQRIEVEKMKLQYEKSVGILNMDGKFQKIKNVLKEHIEKCEEYFYQAVNYIERVSKSEYENGLLEELYNITNTIIDENCEYVYTDEKITITEKIKNYEEIKRRILTPEIEKDIEESRQKPYIIETLVNKLQLVIQVKNDNQRKNEEIKNDIMKLEDENKNLNNLIENNKQELINIEKNIEMLNEKNEKQKEKANDKIANNEKEIKEKITKLNEEIATKKGSLTTYEKEVNNIDSELKNLSMLSFMRKNSLTKQLQIYNNNIKNIKEEIEKLTVEKNTISNAINADIAKENKKIKEIEEEIEEEQANKEHYQEELNNNKIQLDNNTKKINYLLEEQKKLIL